MFEISQLRVGDTILFSGEALISRGIKHFTHSRWNHAALYIGDGLIAEATGAGVEINPLKSVIGHAKYVVVRRPVGLTKAKARAIRAEAMRCIGVHYDFFQIVTLGLYFAVRRITGKSLPWLIRDNANRLVCSAFNAQCYTVAGFRFSVAAKLVTPATLYRSRVLETVLEYDVTKETSIWRSLTARLGIQYP